MTRVLDSEIAALERQFVVRRWRGAPDDGRGWVLWDRSRGIGVQCFRTRADARVARVKEIGLRVTFQESPAKMGGLEQAFWRALEGRVRTVREAVAVARMIQAMGLGG